MPVLFSQYLTSKNTVDVLDTTRNILLQNYQTYTLSHIICVLSLVLFGGFSLYTLFRNNLNRKNIIFDSSKYVGVVPLNHNSKSVQKKKICLIGSTGSIGTQTIDIVSSFPNNFEIVGLSCGRNIDLVCKQIEQFHKSLEIVSVANESDIDKIKKYFFDSNIIKNIKFVHGSSGIVECASKTSADVVVTGIVGCAGLLPTIEAIKAGKDIALANKETLIAGGPIIVPLVKKMGIRLLPADSEHSAIFQSLQGIPESRAINKLILTASGGAFRDWTTDDIRNKATKADALKHPNWSMGQKITIDSATLMNKGLEIIEAHYLFDVDYDKIEAVIHPESIVHSAVELSDTSVIAQMGLPDMKLPLLYCLTYPERYQTDFKRMKFDELKNGLNFQSVDFDKYPCVDLAYRAGRIGGTATAILSAANEVVVELFLKDRINFMDIPKTLAKILDIAISENMIKIDNLELDDILQADDWARKTAFSLCQ